MSCISATNTRLRLFKKDKSVEEATVLYVFLLYIHKFKHTKFMSCHQSLNSSNDTIGYDTIFHIQKLADLAFTGNVSNYSL